ncbi:MAG: hypothetical protein U0Q22_09190 [Acidimicrobiales bacterium]
MSVASKIRKRSALLVEIGRRFPLRGLLRQRDASADLVYWAHHRYPDSWPAYVGSGDGVLKDTALLSALIETGRPFRVVSGVGIGDVTNSTIVYCIDEFNPNRVLDYSSALMATLRQLEAQGNTLFPSADEAEFWENKVFMHRRFDELGIRSPETVVVGRDTELDEALAELERRSGAAFGFPLLVKEPHSNNSQGLHTVADRAELEALRRTFADAGAYEFLVQRILDMRRDLRVTMVGGEIVHHYWRINLSDEWMPTTTRKGSQVDFVTFPEQWRERIVGAMDALGLRNGAFDVCWDADDLDTEPYFLEVSPAYTPNPAPSPAFADRPYSDFKAQLRGPDSYTVGFVELVFDLQRRLVAAWGLGSR